MTLAAGPSTMWCHLCQGLGATQIFKLEDHAGLAPKRVRDDPLDKPGSIHGPGGAVAARRETFGVR